MSHRRDFSKIDNRLFCHPIICVISAPSGSGKTTIRKRLMKEMPEIAYSVSCTTRRFRKGEVNGKDYYFLSQDEFKKKIRRNDFVEWAKVHDNYYGTPYKFLQTGIKNGKDVILDLDVKGAIKIKKIFHDSISIFLLPPSYKELVGRLQKRKKDTESIIKKRLNNAKGELKKINHYDYILINDKLNSTVERIKNIFKGEKMRIKRNKKQIQRFIKKEFS